MLFQEDSCELRSSVPRSAAFGPSVCNQWHPVMRAAYSQSGVCSALLGKYRYLWHVWDAESSLQITVSLWHKCSTGGTSEQQYHSWGRFSGGLQIWEHLHRTVWPHPFVLDSQFYCCHHKRAVVSSSQSRYFPSHCLLISVNFHG